MPRKCPIIQINPQDLRVVNYFNSITEATINTGITLCSIDEFINGNIDHIGGYYWNHLDNYIREYYMLGEKYKFIYGNDFDSFEAVKLGISTWNFRGMIDSCLPINLQYIYNGIIYTEEWVDIVGYEGSYKISSFGRVISIKNKIYISLLNIGSNGKGYSRISLLKNNIRSSYSIHRLVALAFISNPFNKPEVNHIDENKINNCIWNLEWMTAKENSNHGTRNDKLSKIIDKIDKFTGEVIEKYNSIHEASRLNNISISNICQVLVGNRNFAGGFSWKYV